MEAVAAVVRLAPAAGVLHQVAAAAAVAVRQEPLRQADQPEIQSSGFSSLYDYEFYKFQNHLY
jgi:hypothetical protein